MPARAASFHPSPYLLLTLASLFWSLNWVVARGMVGHVSPFALTFARWLVAASTMLPFAWPQIRTHWPAVRRHWKTIAWLAFLGTGLANAFTYVGLQYTTATNGLILNSATPILIVLIGWAAYRDTITRVQSIGVGVSIVGVFAILTRGDASVLARLSLNKGDLIVLVGVLFWAAYTVFLRIKPPELPGFVMLAVCGCIGVATLLPFVAVELAFLGGKVEFTPGTVAGMLYVGMLPSFLAYVFWNRAVAEVGSNVAGIFMHLMPAFGALLAWFFLGERIELFHVVGIALILSGIALTTRGRRRVPEPRTE